MRFRNARENKAVIEDVRQGKVDIVIGTHRLLHDKLARIEIAPEELPAAMTAAMCAEIAKRFKAAGFLYVALDLEGYRQGSLNASLGVR